MSPVRFDFRNKQNQIICEAKLLLLPQDDYRCPFIASLCIIGVMWCASGRRVSTRYSCRAQRRGSGHSVSTMYNKHHGKCRMREHTGGPDKRRALVLGSLATHNVRLDEGSRI